MAEILDPELMDEAQLEEAQRRYVEAVQRGESGSRLARSTGIAAPMGSSPPMISPQPIANPPPMRLDSAANYVRYPSGGEIDFGGMERDLANAPIDAAQKAIAAATQYQAMRAYQQDLQSGMDSAKALAKWSPYMFQKGTMAGAASLIRATKPADPWKFYPEEGNVPATFRSGEQIRIVPNSAKPRGPLQDLINEEIMPGVRVIRDPVDGSFKIATGERPMTEYQKLTLMKDLQKMKQDVALMNKSGPEYLDTLKLIRAYEEGVGLRPKQKPSTQFQSPAPTSVKRFRYDPSTKSLQPVQ